MRNPARILARVWKWVNDGRVTTWLQTADANREGDRETFADSWRSKYQADFKPAAQ